MNSILKIFVLALFLVAGACSKKTSGSNTVQYFLFDSPEIARMVFSQGKITCRNNECVNPVGGLSTFTAYKTDRGQIRYEVGVCSMTLVGPDLILTNRHCIPADLRSSGADCLNRIRFRFPTTTMYSSGSFDCKQIVELSKPKSADAAELDWALVQMTVSTIRTPATPNATGVDVKKTVTLYPVEYTLHEVNDLISADGEMHKVRCTTNPDNSLFNQFVNKLSAIFIADDCTEDIIQGNSGSGIFNDNQELVAVGSFGTNTPGIPHNVIGGSNLNCIPYFNTPIGPLCGIP